MEGWGGGFILFTLFAECCPKFKQGRIKWMRASRFCILMLCAAMWVGFLLPHFRSRASLPLPGNKVLSCAAYQFSVRCCKLFDNVFGKHPYMRGKWCVDRMIVNKCCSGGGDWNVTWLLILGFSKTISTFFCWKWFRLQKPVKGCWLKS